ncbi:hypothetical protein [uncultured Pseudonocardia sp.]|uniref:hypothetical protein n=1 Tax=uncultured Pseudonocardia sp. TaxID=211455 RepID=UPI00261DE7E0|nr:hypothetical protein [uncultured Pseudonocardia sp.]
MYDPEALVQDADIELAEMAAVGDALHHWRARGICQHQSVQGPDGRIECREGTGGCAAVFTGPEQWYAAMDRALDGQPPSTSTSTTATGPAAPPAQPGALTTGPRQ